MSVREMWGWGRLGLKIVQALAAKMEKKNEELALCRKRHAQESHYLFKSTFLGGSVISHSHTKKNVGKSRHPSCMVPSSVSDPRDSPFMQLSLFPKRVCKRSSSHLLYSSFSFLFKGQSLKGNLQGSPFERLFKGSHPFSKALFKGKQRKYLGFLNRKHYCRDNGDRLLHVSARQKGRAEHHYKDSITYLTFF